MDLAAEWLGRLPWGATPEDARQIFTAYAEAGGNFVDTANTYSQGNSEQIAQAVTLADLRGWTRFAGLQGALQPGRTDRGARTPADGALAGADR